MDGKITPTSGEKLSLRGKKRSRMRKKCPFHLGILYLIKNGKGKEKRENRRRNGDKTFINTEGKRV